jgi:hypothetical protein
VELGVGLAGFSMNNPDGGNNNLTIFGLGTAFQSGLGVSSGSGVTAAFYLNEMIAIEPGFGFLHAKSEGATDATTFLSFQVGVPIYLKKGWGKAGGLFVTPYVGMNRASSSGTTSTQNHFGANVGTKMKISDNLFWRVQVGYDMGLKSKTPADPEFVPKSTSFGAAFGLNLYLH